MSKGWITIQFDDIVDVQVSSLGKMRFMTKRQDVSVTGLGGPTGTKLLEHIRDYLQNRKEGIDQKTQQARKEVQEKTKSQANSAEEIAKFAELKEQGIITEEEFQKKKDELL